VILSSIRHHKFFRPAAGALLCVLCGLALGSLSLGDPWVRASYDNLFRFGSHRVTNDVVVVFMDNEAFAALGQDRTHTPPWDRALHAQLLNKLADDGCALVVMDVVFMSEGKDMPKDNALVTAMSRVNRLALAAEQAGSSHTGIESASPILPLEKFLHAAKTNWGVAWSDPDPDLIVRHHWPLLSPGPYSSLSWRAAELTGAKLDETPRERWIRYYGASGAWTAMGFHHALNKGTNYFKDKIVFIGNKPATTLDDREYDEFCSPCFNWTGETSGGVEILATGFLNLCNGDWLERLPPLAELLLLVSAGAMLGGLCWFGRGAAIGLAAATALVVTAGGVCLSYYTNYWFPWLIIAGGQLPCALLWTLATAKASATAIPATKPVKLGPNQTVILNLPDAELPEAPEYEIFTPEIGKGGFGKVWIVRNAIGQYQALKAVYQSKFGEDRGPYEAEFKGLQRYKPVSEKHPGLLRIDLVSKMKAEGYFYYVMELGDAQEPGWEKNPKLYKPRDLENLRKQAAGRRLPVAECLRIVVVLAEALDFLHQQGLTHRDIKPSNVIFVNGRPKLADIGLVADIRPLDEVNTLVGTLGYMPPPPEKPGTPQADIYALGMLLYVIGTGRDPGRFPELSTTLIDGSGHAEFMRLNAIVLKACQPEVSQRYQKTADMLADLRRAASTLPAA
jgi:CHASE2 domain-containing sensor protein